MSDAVYKTIELTGCSSESMEAAVRNAVSRAARSLRDIKWFEVLETRGAVRDGGVAEWQVTVKVAFRIEDELRTAQI
jgi:flavin-binding protein dodecin